MASNKTGINGTEGYLTSEFFTRVFRISRGNSMGTCFVTLVDGEIFLATAKHILQNDEKAPILFHQAQGKIDCEAHDIRHGKGDCAIFKTNVFGDIGHPLPYRNGGWILGSQVFYLGFPFEILTTNLPDSDFWPTPFVKRATISGTDARSGVFYLDGMNASGFSGGPVIAFDPIERVHFVCAVVSGYYKDHYPVRTTENWYKDTDFLSEGNSGIILASGLSGLCS